MGSLYAYYYTCINFNLPIFITGVDYTFTSLFVGLNYPEFRTCISVSFTDDSDIEGSEDFMLRLDLNPSYAIPDEITVDPNGTLITILDNDGT